MIIILGGGFFTVVGFLILIALGYASALAVWLVEHATAVGIAWLIFQFFFGILLIISLLGNIGSSFLAVFLGTFRLIPPAFVLRNGYQYLLLDMEKEGTASALFDFVIVMGIYFLVGCVYNKFVFENGVGPLGSVLITILHFSASCFLIYAFAHYL